VHLQSAAGNGGKRVAGDSEESAALASTVFGNSVFE